MPLSRQVCSSDAPLGAIIVRSLIVRVASSANARDLSALEGASPGFNVGAVLGGELRHRGPDGPGRGLTERAQRFAVDVVADVFDDLEVLRLAAAVLDPVHHARQPERALAAGRAFTA